MQLKHSCDDELTPLTVSRSHDLRNILLLRQPLHHLIKMLDTEVLG